SRYSALNSSLGAAVGAVEGGCHSSAPLITQDGWSLMVGCVGNGWSGPAGITMTACGEKIVVAGDVTPGVTGVGSGNAGDSSTTAAGAWPDADVGRATTPAVV